MSTPEIIRFLTLAQQQMQQGQLPAAVESLRRVLGLDPDLADAHALLALCLLDLRRAHAAEHEAELALAFDPESELALYASGLTLTARRKLKAAESQFRALLERQPGDPAYHRALADVHDLMGRRNEVLPRLQLALELDPADPETLVDIGRYRLADGDVASAELGAREALEIVPEHHEALVLMGNVLLQRGEVEDAREHALWALRHNPGSRPALHLMAAVKARKSPFLGIWWRYNAWMGGLGEGRAILVLLGAFVLYRVGVIAASDAAKPEVAELINMVWLAIVAYTWVGPAWFRRSVEKELATVKLDERF